MLGDKEKIGYRVSEKPFTNRYILLFYSMATPLIGEELQHLGKTHRGSLNH